MPRYLCPRCGRKLVIRKVHSGAGNKYYDVRCPNCPYKIKYLS